MNKEILELLKRLEKNQKDMIKRIDKLEKKINFIISDEGNKEAAKAEISTANDNLRDIPNHKKNTSDKKQSNEIDIIEKIRERLKWKITNISYNTWFESNTKAAKVENDTLKLICCNSFTVDVIEKKYKDLLLDICKKENININNIIFEVISK